MKRLGWVPCAAQIAFLLGAAAATASAQVVSVQVNNRPVTFIGTAPVQQKGAVLVPLRGVFEALGASVNYNPTSKSITATKGASSFSLTVGSTTAIVNGSAEILSQPAEVVNGATLVPLRFVAEALGAYVQWQPATLTVQIVTPELHLSTLPALTVPAGHTHVVGRLTGIYSNTTPQQITVRVNGQVSAVPLSTSTVVTVRNDDSPKVQEDISHLHVGDQVHVSLAPDGTAATIEADYGEVVGTIKDIQRQDGAYVVNLNDGTSVTMVQDADVKMSGRNIVFADIMPAERVRINTDPTNKIGYSLSVVTDGQSDDDSEPPTAQPAPSQTSSVVPNIQQPSITDQSPADGAEVTSPRPMIYALMNLSPNTPFSLAHVRLWVDHHDVTPNAVVTQRFVTYQPSTSLTPGSHTVELALVDPNGGSADSKWTFTTSPQSHSYTFTSDVPGKSVALSSGKCLGLTLVADPGGTAFVTLGSMTQQLCEIKPGVYTCRIEPTADIELQDAIATAHFTSPDHNEATVDLPQAVSFASLAPQAPKIESPSPGQQVGRRVQIAGVSAPGSTVLVQIDYTTKALGLLNMDGTSAQTEAKADMNGNWKTGDIELMTPTLLGGARQTALTIAAVAVDAVGNHSPRSSIKVSTQ